MAGLGDKTPVSLLTEYLISKKLIPKFELTHNGVGTHKPEFKYQIQVGDHCEEGIGRSKQEAKHRAAEKMLKSLKVIEVKGDEEESNDLPLESAENYVGELKELCLIMHYPEPKYLLEEAAGPPHSRVFKMICSVSTLQEFGISKTKKQAKQLAAFKMLQILKDKEVNEALLHESFCKLAGLTSEDDSTKKFFSLKSINLSNFKDPAALYSDSHMAYISYQETSPTLAEILKKKSTVNCENSTSLLQMIAKELETTLTSEEIPSNDKNINYIVMSMSVFPPIAGAGFSEQQAAFNLLNSLLILCSVGNNE